MHLKPLRVLLPVLALALVPAARADVVPNSLFTDHAVLQREKPIFIWGTAEPGEQIRISLSNETGTRRIRNGQCRRQMDRAVDALASRRALYPDYPGEKQGPT